jgi:hypothetical protein
MGKCGHKMGGREEKKRKRHRSMQQQQALLRGVYIGWKVVVSKSHKVEDIANRPERAVRAHACFTRGSVYVWSTELIRKERMATLH